MNGRVRRIHSGPSCRVTSAPTAKANGTANSVYPEYSIGGWIIMLGWRSSGLSPAPSAGGAASAVERRLEEDQQAAEERAEAEQHRGRVGRDLAQPAPGEEEDRAAPQASRSTHSSSEPSCDDHTAVTR